MIVYLARHCTSVTNEQGLVCGSTDVPLSQSGRTQAYRLSRALDSLEPDLVYCSPLVRARDSIAHSKHFSTMQLVEHIKEMDTGNFSSLSVDELYRINPRYRYQGRYAHLRYPNGECFNDLYHRIIGWFSNAQSQWRDDQKVAIVGHEATVCCILHAVAEIPLANYPLFSVKNADVFAIHMDRHENQKRIELVFRDAQ